ncbi:MAG: hypothetical protein GQ570_13925 [Helicobacteraceae bacterium]|nr:hypothetical protein [Helicobacteraceae bacterium]
MVAILHEGNIKDTNENALLKLLIKELGYNPNSVEFFGFGSKSNFFKTDNLKYTRLKLQIDEEAISKILFVVDADFIENDVTYGGFENTERELKAVIKTLSLTPISDIYVTRDPNTNDGYLESLILSSIPTVQKECIENFLNCSKFKSKDNDKAILNVIYKNAYPNAPYDFSHENFNELKGKLHSLLKIN